MLSTARAKSSRWVPPQGAATREHVAESLCPQDDRPAATKIRTRLDPKQVVELEMMVRLGHAHGRGERCAHGDAQRSCRFAWLKGGRSRRLRAKHRACRANLHGNLRKKSSPTSMPRDDGLERAIVIFSGHAQSIVRTLALSGLCWPTRRRHASTVRYRVACTRTQRLFGPQQRRGALQGGRRGNTGSVAARLRAARA